MTDEIEKPQTNWVRIALIASLALNLLIAGLVAGAMSRGPDGGHMREMVDGDGFRAMPGRCRLNTGVGLAVTCSNAVKNSMPPATR